VDLGRFVRERGPLPEPALVAVALELCSALVHAHGRGVIHRALKPENVLLARGRLVLTDFGIVKGFGAGQPLGEEGARRQTAVVGVPGYTAPEQLEQKALDGRTDLFAFGALLYFLATRKLPYEADNRDALLEVFRKGKPEPLGRLRPDLSMDVTNLVHRCLEPNPDRRPESADRLRHSFQRVLERRGQRDARELLALYERDALMTGVAWAPVGFVEATGETPLPFRRSRRRRRRVVMAAGLALLAVALALGAAAALGWRPELPRAVTRLLGR
jgi:serine/threonine-protein kinase